MSSQDPVGEWTEEEMQELEQHLGRLATPAEARATIDAIARAGVRRYLARQQNAKILPLHAVPEPTEPSAPRTLVAVKNTETRTATCMEYAVVCVYSDNTEAVVWGRTVPLNGFAPDSKSITFIRTASDMAVAGLTAWAEQSRNPDQG